MRWIAGISLVASTMAMTLAHAANVQTAQGSASVAATGHDVHNPRGEDRNCQDLAVKCSTASVSIPADATVISVTREAENQGGGNWTENPYTGLGWCDWENNGQTTSNDGRQLFTAQLKNWSQNISRNIRITVKYTIDH
jgi:hypothetical protein